MNKGKTPPNRVAGGAPPATTPPGMRVRTGRFPKTNGPIVALGILTMIGGTLALYKFETNTK